MTTAVPERLRDTPTSAGTGWFAGALSDRWNRRRVMVSADLVNAVVIGSIPLAHWLGVLTVAQVLVVGFVVQMVYTFFDGANFGALPVLVGRSRVAQANAAVWTAADIAEGVRFLVRHPGVRTMTIVGSLQSFAGGGFVALMVVWCDRVLDVGTSGLRFGLVFGAWGIGGLVAAVGLPRLLRRLPPAAITLYALPVSAVLGIVTALMPNWPLAAIALLAWGSAYVLVIVNAIS